MCCKHCGTQQNAESLVNSWRQTSGVSSVKVERESWTLPNLILNTCAPSDVVLYCSRFANKVNR